jgi:hypothetical protein
VEGRQRQHWGQGLDPGPLVLRPWAPHHLKVRPNGHSSMMHICRSWGRTCRSVSSHCAAAECALGFGRCPCQDVWYMHVMSPYCVTCLVAFCAVAEHVLCAVAEHVFPFPALVCVCTVLAARAGTLSTTSSGDSELLHGATTSGTSVATLPISTSTVATGAATSMAPGGLGGAGGGQLGGLALYSAGKGVGVAAGSPKAQRSARYGRAPHPGHLPVLHFPSVCGGQGALAVGARVRVGGRGEGFSASRLWTCM